MPNIMLIGEAYGEKEEELGRPFVGPSGWLLDQMLSHAGISRSDCYITNVFNLRPKPSNDIENLCGNKGEGIPNLPALAKGKFVRAEYAPELDRLFAEINREQPNIIVALGATAAWALLGTSGIKTIRGAVAMATTPRLSRPYAVLPTYHPAMVAREYTARPIVIADLSKALRHSHSPEFTRPSRLIWTHPTLQDLAEYEQHYILPAEILSADIETSGNQITCIGFSPSPNSAIVIPFFAGANGHYWKTAAEEVEALNFARRWLELKPTIFQNGMYDLSVLWRYYGIPVPQAMEDTMLLHHAWQPEMLKGLGFLATIYTDEPAWKFMRKGLKHD